jgi:hypothetical protein
MQVYVLAGSWVSARPQGRAVLISRTKAEVGWPGPVPTIERRCSRLQMLR